MKVLVYRRNFGRYSLIDEFTVPGKSTEYVMEVEAKHHPYIINEEKLFKEMPAKYQQIACRILLGVQEGLDDGGTMIHNTRIFRHFGKYFSATAIFLVMDKRLNHKKLNVKTLEEKITQKMIDDYFKY